MKPWLLAGLLALPVAARAQHCALRPDATAAYCAGAAADACAKAGQLLQDAAALDADIAACEGALCAPERAIALAGRARGLRSEPAAKDPRLAAIAGCLSIAEARLERLARAEARRDLRGLPDGDDVERLLRALEAKAPGARSREELEAADRAADQAWRSWSRASYALDDDQVLDGSDLAQARERLNALAERLAGWRDRLKALFRQAGLPVAPDAERAARELEGSHVPSALRLPSSLALAPAAPASAPSAQPDVYGFAPGRVSLRVPAPDRSAALAKTFTRVVGDPVGRGKLLHRQTSERCAVVSQQEVLQAYGLVPSRDPKAVEEALSRRTWELGQRSYENKGTYSAFIGNLLQERGILTIKRAAATREQLEEAARTGRLMTLDVDAGKLWAQPKYDGQGHTVAVTGARVDGSGRVLGYYVNDSGDDQAVPGRYVPSDELLAAWRHSFVQAR